MNVEVRTAVPTKGGLILRDSVVFLVLCCATVALFSTTLVLFRSFERHREDLGKQWSQRGRMALQQGRPLEAVSALRTALSYKPNERADQLMLAQALAAAGRTEEADSYFLNLREARPGDGFVNLQLARLARKQGDASQATEYYRASIFGNWEGDGSTRRREVRLELADYLVQRGDLAAARAELLIAAGNAPEDANNAEVFGDRLAAAGDPSDALQLYKQALQGNPHNATVLAKAGRLTYVLGDYPEADRLLTNALERGGRGTLNGKDRAAASALEEAARRMPQLLLSRELPAVERTEHLLSASGIAQRRLTSCSAQVEAPRVQPASTNPGTQTPVNSPSPSLQGLRAQWTALAKQLNRRALQKDAALQDQVMQLVDDTETRTAAVCGPPAGDDALLLEFASPNRRFAQP